MANIENLEKKFVELIKNDDSFAIALTGEWGIGKTHFWKNFRDKNKEVFFGKKYAYISLFGLDSLESLKLAIATEVQTQTSDDSILNVDVSKHFKKLFGFIGGGSASTSGDMRFGINIGNNLVTNIIMSHLKNTLVCLDDIERKSGGLPMSEILGLVNYLKNDRKCQVLIIMHDEESDDKDYFDKHKEKVFDEVLILNESLPIIRDNISNVATFPIYEKFYQTMDVRNLRFYKRVQKIYHEITKHSSSLSKLSKEEIIRQILVIKLVNDIPKVLDIDMKELKTYFSENGLDDRLDTFLKSDDEVLKTTVRTKRDDVEKKLSKFYPNFRMEGWTEVVIELITNIDINNDKFESLLDQDIITEQALKSDREKRDLMAEYHSLSPEKDFNQRLFDNIKHRIDREMLPNLSSYCNILKKNGASDLSNQLEESVEEHIEARVAEGSEQDLIQSYYFNHSNRDDFFYNLLQKTIKEHKRNLTLNNNADTMSKIFMRFYEHGNESEDFFDAIQNISKVIFSHVIWQPITNGSSRMLYIREVLKHPAFRVDIAKFNNGDRVDTVIWNYKELVDAQKPSPFIHQPVIIQSKLNEVKQWTLELLQVKITENLNSKAAIEQLLELTNNLENI